MSTGGSTELSSYGSHSSLARVEARVQEAFGLSMESLPAQLVLENPPLHRELAELPLNEHFDDYGGRRFPMLGGLMFAAKQQGSPIGRSFGSSSEHFRRTTPPRKTRSELLAAEAKERDMEYGRRWVSDMVGGIEDAERHRVEDVKWRQLEVLFGEVPSWQTLLPAGTTPEELLPLDVDKGSETQNRLLTDRENVYVFKYGAAAAREPAWAMSRTEAWLLLQVAELWAKAARGPRGARGMDRASFCRLLLDLGLVDQQRVPFFWAVSLFDSEARSLRYPFYGQGDMFVTLSVVSWKSFVCIMDLIVKQHFGDGNRGAFLSSLFSIAKFRLPEFIIDECGLGENGEHDVSTAGRMRRMGGFWVFVNEQGEPIGRSRGTDSGESRGSPTMTGRRAMPPEETNAWLRMPEHPMTEAEVAKEIQTREELVRCLLVEPEVLHVIAQHQHLFEAIHRAYANGAGDMSYISLHMFCIDFNIIPALISAHSLREVYSSTKSVEAVEPEEGAHPKHNVKEKGGRPSRNSDDSPRNASGKASPAPDRASPAVPSQATTVGIPHDLPWARVVKLAKMANQASDTASSQAPVNVKPPGRSNRSTTFHRHRARELWKKASMHESASTFGCGALAEALCRVAFTYLSFYGNAQQQSMGGHARAVWLIIYIRAGLEHYWDSPELGRLPDCPLRRLLNSTTQEAIGQPPCDRQQFAGGLARTTVRRGVGPAPETSKEVAERTKHLKCEANQLLGGTAEMTSAGPKSKSPPASKAASKEPSVAEDARSLSHGPGVMTPSSASSPLDGTEDDDEDFGDSDSTSLHEETPQPEIQVEVSRKNSLVKAAVEGGLMVLPSRKPSRIPQGGSTSPSRDPDDCTRMKARRSSHHARIGTYCIHEGVCRLCKADVDERPWGRATCHGCSVVDVYRFRQHPFKPLLVDWHPSMPSPAPSAVAPVPTYKAALETPPILKRHELREGARVQVPVRLVAATTVVKTLGDHSHSLGRGK